MVRLSPVAGDNITDKKNILYKFILNNGRLKGCFINATELVNTVREKHSLEPLETLVLGHAFIGASLMSASLKNTESIRLKIECSGAVKGLSVETNSLGEARGYLFQNPIPFRADSLSRFDTSPLFEAGFISVTRFSEGNKSYSGQVMIEHGRIAEDLANYFLVSEQIKTAVLLSINFDKNGLPAGAGGLFIQAMPDALEEDIVSAEKAIEKLPSIGRQLAEETDVTGFLMNSFASSGIEILSTSHVHFKCRCSRERFFSFLSAMDKKEIESILGEGALPLRLICHNCSSEYLFEREEIEKLKT